MINGCSGKMAVGIWVASEAVREVVALEILEVDTEVWLGDTVAEKVAKEVAATEGGWVSS